VNHETKDGSTPLKSVVRDNKRDLCQLLLRRGADPAFDIGGTSAIDIAQAKVDAGTDYTICIVYPLFPRQQWVAAVRLKWTGKTGQTVA